MALSYGGDYNPEQWPEEVWPEDVRLMREAGVGLVTVGVFSWALLEPAEGRYEFGWLDRVLDLLHDGGIQVDLATATASPPPWLARAHPEMLPVTADGTRLWPGSRQAYCPSSPVFRAAATALARGLAERYHSHPALAMWHVGNEYGAHVARCWCDVSAQAFREWLGRRYGDVDALNAAWGTAFWSQRYGDLAEVLPPRSTPAQANPAQLLDFARFSSDELLACYTGERDVLRELSPGVPVTTNFMVPMVGSVDLHRWAGEVDVVANDHYLTVADPEAHLELALGGDVCRGLSGGAPWLLMEHSTSAVNWQPRNVAKQPGQMRRNSLAHVARGADGVLFFQWRASRAGAEKWHSALLPHAGTDSRIWREVVQLGADLRALAGVQGSRVHADVALLWDWECDWATGQGSLPSVDVTYLDAVRRWYSALWHRGITVDAVHPSADLSGYRLVLAPSLYLVDDPCAAALTTYVEGGGHLAVGYFSGLVDQHDRIRPGAYPGAFRDVLGLWIEEFFPLLQDQRVHLSGGGQASVWTELVHPAGAQVLDSFLDGPVAGGPAVTRHTHGRGVGWYVATRPDASTLAALLGRICEQAGVAPVVPGLPAGVEAVRRGRHLFVLNHLDREVAVATHGIEVLTGAEVTDTLELPPGGVGVVLEPAPEPQAQIPERR